MAEAKKTEEAVEKKSGGSKLVVILLIVVILLLGGVLGGGAYLFLSGKLTPQGAAQVADAEGHAEEGEHKKPKKEKKDKAHAAPTYVLIGEEKAPFTVNLAETSEADYLQVEVQVLISDPAVEGAIKTHMPLLKSKLGALFSQQKSAEIKTAQGREQLRLHALEEVRKVMGSMTDTVDPEDIEDLLFTNFVMQ
ncbi:MAG: flagellar basal body-associated FliL family protein [Halothiobacillaceae bacterium]|nr:MAG: flagellar basal body-associated FliL family protein [Halothiobacillaceae bacterium]